MYFPVDLDMVSSVIIPLSSLLNLHLLQSKYAHILVWFCLTFLSLQWMLAIWTIFFFQFSSFIFLWFVLFQNLQTFTSCPFNASNHISGNYCHFQYGCCSEKAMAPHSSTLAWKIPWMEEPGGLQFMGSLRVERDWATSLTLSCIGEGNGNPLQCSCLENPRDGA